MAARNKPVCLSLQGLEHLEQLNGMTYNDLPVEAQHIFLSSLISMRIVQSDASEDGLFELYTGMNTGSKNHSKQQNRRAIFRYILYLGRHVPEITSLQQAPCQFCKVHGGDDLHCSFMALFDIRGWLA